MAATPGGGYHFFFYSKIETLPADFDKAEIEELILVNALEVPNDKLAFESTKIGIGLVSQNIQ